MMKGKKKMLDTNKKFTSAELRAMDLRLEAEMMKDRLKRVKAPGDL